MIFSLSMENQINIYQPDSYLNQTMWIGYHQEHSDINSMMSHRLQIELRRCLISYIYGRILLDFGKHGMS